MVQPSTVDFPSSELTSRSIQQHVLQTRPPYLPFRRISLPTAPSLLHRQSVASVASFDSLPEESGSPALDSPISPVARGANGPRRLKGRPPSNDSPRKANRRRESGMRPVNEAMESKRRNVIHEFYETEKAYVEGLELIYSHFLTPIITSLDTPQPLLDRGALTTVFSNFIDIWNLHRSFFSSLTTLLTSDTSSGTLSQNPPPLSPILLSHFPYLSLYTPFVTSFSTVISSLMNLLSANSPDFNPAFAAFVAMQESDPRCGKLKLRDWLLTIVQRCPRYLLLLKDLIRCTDSDDAEYTQLTAVHTLVSKITLSLNTSLHTHAQTLSLLALQRATPNLPFQLIAPGRTLLKRGALVQVEGSAAPHEREFLLFSDYFVWLASEDAERGWTAEWSMGLGVRKGGWMGGGGSPTGLARPPMVRSRSKSEAELSLLKDRQPDVATPPSRKSYYHAPPPSPSKKIQKHVSSEGEERWVYKGRAALVDLDVVVLPAREEGEDRRLEIMSPEGSFVLYAASEAEREEWASCIRSAKAQLLVSLNVTHPNSTLTSSSSTTHLRRTLQALPYQPSDARISSVRHASTRRKSWADSRIDDSSPKAKSGKGAQHERRGRVEHWVPAIWIPDGKTEGCMRCGRAFGWRRRRHHCRLCGRCVCAACSGRTFFISDPSADTKDAKPARACDACYETVFPLLDVSTDDASPLPDAQSTSTFGSLANFPSWLSMPSLPTPRTPQALMSIDAEPRSGSAYNIAEQHSDGHGGDVRERRERVRIKTPSRPRSYHQILEDFEDLDSGREDGASLREEEDTDGNGGEHAGNGFSSSAFSQRPPAVNLSSPSPRREDTARRNKRFSMPAVALQTTSVTAQTQQVSLDDNGPGRSKRFSLVLGSRLHGGKHDTGRRGEDHSGGSKVELGKGAAAGKLSELLGRRRE